MTDESKQENANEQKGIETETAADSLSKPSAPIWLSPSCILTSVGVFSPPRGCIPIPEIVEEQQPEHVVMEAA